MLHEDYLVRMFLALAAAIKNSIIKSRGDGDPSGAADLIEAALSDASEIDGTLLLKLAPESMASMLELAGTDPKLAGYISRSLILESEFLTDAGQPEKASLRYRQGVALADKFGLFVDTENFDEDLEQFLESEEQEA